MRGSNSSRLPDLQELRLKSAGVTDAGVRHLQGLTKLRRIDFLRRSGRATFCDIDEAPESHSESPEQILLRSEHREYLEDGLRLLSARERAAIIMRDVEGLPAEEVAERMNCSKATVRSHIANGRTKFRRYMERRKR